MGDIETGDLRSTTKPQAQIGYSLWASRIASDTDQEPLIFRKFDNLGALNLLYLQSEMIGLETKIQDLDTAVAQRLEIESVNAARDWDILRRDATSSGSAGQEPLGLVQSRDRMGLILELRQKIKDYHEALLLQSQIAQLQKPNNRVVQATQHMFVQDGYSAIDGKARDYLYADDLVALKSPTKDLLSNYLRKARIMRVRNTLAQTKDPESKYSSYGLARFDEHKVTQLVNLITILVATVFLAGPILALYFSKSAPARLSIIVLFTAGFAASVSLITNARRAEIFLGSATYAAVLVVFISNGDLAGGNGS